MRNHSLIRSLLYATAKIMTAPFFKISLPRKGTPCLLLLTLLTGCGHDFTGSKTMPIETKFTIDGANAFVKYPKTFNGQKIPWVLFAPVVGNEPSDTQHSFHQQRLLESGVAFVGIDTGESYGSPRSRELIKKLVDHLRASGFKDKGCALAQSRGGLQVYGFIADHPNHINCVAGIYPLLSLTDYASVPAFAPAWGVSEADMWANLSTWSPHNRINQISQTNNLKVFHVHGDLDQTTHHSIDQAFVQGLVAAGVNAQLQTVIGQAHEFYSEEFFKNESLVQFLIENAKLN